SYTIESYLFFIFFTLPPPPSSTLFPYTTLFRSSTLPFIILLKNIFFYKSRSFFYIEVMKFARANFFPLNLKERFRNERNLTTFRSEEHTSELQSRFDLVCRLLLEKKKNKYNT